MNVLKRTLAFLCLAGALAAEDFTLVDGRYLQVKILESDGVGMRVLVLQTGGTVYVPWDRVIARDRERLQLALGLTEVAREMPTEMGVRMTMKVGGDVYLGKIVKETPEEVTIRSGGRDLPFKRNLITEISQELVPVTAIETGETLYAARLKDLAPTDDDIAGQMELAEFAELLGRYEEAVGHLLKVASADAEYEPVRIKRKLEMLEALAKNKAFRDALDETRRLANATLFKRALATLAELDKIPDVPASLKSEIATYAEMIGKRRYEHFRVKVREGYFGILKVKIQAMSRDEKLKLNEAQQELRSKLHKAIVADLGQRLELDPKEVEAMWKERKLGSPRSASYGSGSFIVLGVAKEAQEAQQRLQRQMQQDAARRNQQGRGNNQGGSVSSEPEKLPKPPTKDEWWNYGRSTDKEQWMMCYWAENSKQVEVVGERWDDCDHCGARGTKGFSGSQGEEIRVTCPLCQGHKRYKGVRYK